MRLRRHAVLVLLALLVAGAVAPARGAETLRISGVLVAIEPDDGRMVVEEVGPWQVRQGATLTIRRLITLTPSTAYDVFIRVETGAPSGFPGDFIPVELDATQLTVGDFVTVECRSEGGRLVAVRVTRAEDPAP